MSDDNFSLDELLNEYSGKSSSDLDLDSILGSTPAVESPPYEPEMEKRRMELIKREIISGDYEHKYLGMDYRDVIDEENRRREDKARKIAEITKAMEQRSAAENASAQPQPSSAAPPHSAQINAAHSRHIAERNDTSPVISERGTGSRNRSPVMTETGAGSRNRSPIITETGTGSRNRSPIISESGTAQTEPQSSAAQARHTLSQRFREEVQRSDTMPFNAVSNGSTVQPEHRATTQDIREDKTMIMPAVREAAHAAPPKQQTAAPKNEEPPLHEKKHPLRRKKITEEDEDEFQRKYEELTRMGLGVKSKDERRASAASEAFDEVISEMEKNPRPGRTFSEKAEEDSPYGEIGSSTERRRRTPKAVTDRSGLVSYTQNNSKLDKEIREAADPLDSITNNSVDKIVSEYEKAKTFNAATMKIGEKSNTLSDFLDKLMKPDSPEAEAADRKSGRNNTEMLENMKRAKKERLSRTTNIPPIERTHISDLKLDLDDKIINDDDEHQDEEAMMNAIQERSNDRKKNFKFVGEEDSSFDDTDSGEESSYIDDFENLDDAESIADDIQQSKSSMIVRLLTLFICFLLSLYITVSNEIKAPVFEFVSMTDEPSAYLFINTILGMIAAFAAYNAIAVGMVRLFTLRANCDSFAALTSIITIALSMVGLLDTELVREGILHEYVPIGIAALIFNTLGKLLLLDKTQRNFSYISGDYEHCAMFTVKDENAAENFTKGSLTDFPTLAAMRRTEMISDFMKISYSPDMSDRFCRMFAPIVLISSLVIGIIGAAAAKADYGGRAVYIGITSFVSCLCMCSCFSSMLTVNLPMRKASIKFNNMQGALIGFDAIDEFSETNSVLVDSGLLFPKGSVTLANIKIFSDTRIDEAIVEAASLACYSGSIMSNMFYDIIAGKTSLLNPVESYIYEDSMGLCGWINNKRVLLGNRKLMENHSIDGIPSVAKEKQYTNGGRTVPVYLSISGELSAMFLINLVPARGVGAAMRDLERNHIKVILRSVDSAVTVERMAQMFNVSPGMLKILPFRTHSDFEKVTSYTPKQSASLVCSGRFGSFASLIISTKRIRTTVMAGIAVQAVSILLGILLSALLVLFKAYGDLAAGTLLIYNLIFTVIYVLISFFRKV